MRQIFFDGYDDYFSSPTMHKQEQVFSKCGNYVDLSNIPTNHPISLPYNSPDPSREPKSVQAKIPIFFLSAAPSVIEPSGSPSVETIMMMSPYPSTSSTGLLSGMSSAYPSSVPYLAASIAPSEVPSTVLSYDPSA